MVAATRALVATTGAFTLTLVPALALVPSVTGLSPAVASPVLTAFVAPVLYVLFGRAEGDAEP